MSSVGKGSTEVTASLIEAARAVNSDALSLEDTLSSVIEAARRSLPEFGHISVSVLDADGDPRTTIGTDDLVWELDDVQYSLEEGPCLDSMRTRSPMVALEHAESDPRWPNYLRRARTTGLRAQLGVRLSSDSETLGSLNLYSTTSSTIDPDSPLLAELFATHAAIALGRSRREEQLHDALSSRKTIGQAIGLTMERYRIDEERAFAFLVRASQTSNVKLRQIAHRVVELTNEKYSPASGHLDG